MQAPMLEVAFLYGTALGNVCGQQQCLNLPEQFFKTRDAVLFKLLQWQEARDALPNSIRVLEMMHDDSWLRDTAPTVGTFLHSVWLPAPDRGALLE